MFYSFYFHLTPYRYNCVLLHYRLPWGRWRESNSALQATSFLPGHGLQSALTWIDLLFSYWCCSAVVRTAAAWWRYSVDGWLKKMCDCVVEFVTMMMSKWWMENGSCRSISVVHVTMLHMLRRRRRRYCCRRFFLVRFSVLDSTFIFHKQLFLAVSRVLSGQLCLSGSHRSRPGHSSELVNNVLRKIKLAKLFFFITYSTKLQIFR